MGVFKLRKNKKFSYTPRFYKANEDGSSPFEIKHKFDDQRKTIGSNGLKSKFTNALDELKRKSNFKLIGTKHFKIQINYSRSCPL